MSCKLRKRIIASYISGQITGLISRWTGVRIPHSLPNYGVTGSVPSMQRAGTVSEISSSHGNEYCWMASVEVRSLPTPLNYKLWAREGNWYTYFTQNEMLVGSSPTVPTKLLTLRTMGEQRIGISVSLKTKCLCRFESDLTYQYGHVENWYIGFAQNEVSLSVRLRPCPPNYASLAEMDMH